MGLQAVISLLCLGIAVAVNRPPNMVKHPEMDIWYKPMESVEIACIAEGIPNPIYIWKRNGIVFNPSGNDDRVGQLPNQGTIVFINPEPKDEGIFQCFADNGYGIAASVRVNFREAKLARFPTDERKLELIPAGNSATLQCTPPQSFPPADVYWVIKERDNRWQAINFDKRVSMDIEGRLRITNVKKSDEYGGRAYACMALNYFMRDNSIGPEIEIKVTGSTEQKHAAAELWTSPSDQFFKKGSIARMKCIFSGNPTPDVYWERVKGSLPDRASIKSFGQELQITDVQMEDAGQYQCMGLNTESKQRATKAFDVGIESAPEWTEEPKNQEKTEGEKATFICKAFGIPAPVIEWFINGVPLADSPGAEGVRDPRIYNNPRFHKVGDNNITLTNLTLEDHMSIQCNASNKQGYVFSNVYLNVMIDQAPEIELEPPDSIKVAESQSVVIPCIVRGKPDPLIEWYRDTTLITGGRFKILPLGSLEISQVVMADAGRYHCQASNKFGFVKSEKNCSVEVKRRTRIEQFPEDLEVVAGFDAKFTCSGSTDFDEARNMVVTWEKDDKPVATNENRMTQNFQDNSLTISGTIVRDSGRYTCVISNGLDTDRAFAFLTVKARPDPPDSVEIYRCLENRAELKWIEGIENNAPVNYFIIQYNTTFNPDQWVSAVTVNYTENTAIIDLSPWVNYTFRVIAQNKIGMSVPSLHTPTVCRTNPTVPFRNPANVKAIGDRRNKLKIEWTPMNQMEHNGRGFKYSLTYHRSGQQPQTLLIDDWRNNSVEINANDPYEPYQVKIQAKNSMGDSSANVNNYTLYSYEDVPSGIVSNVEVSEISASSARLTWTWDKVWMEESGAINQIHGEFRGFRIGFWRAEEKASTFIEVEVPYREVLPKEVPSGTLTVKSSYLLTGLTPYSTIQLQIRLANNFYVGPPSPHIVFQTFEGVPGPVLGLEARVTSSNSFTLVWRPPERADRNGVIVAYDIAYQTVIGLELGLFHDRDVQIDDPNAVSGVLSGLLPNTKYRIYVFARTKLGRGEEAFIEVRTTEKAAIGVPQFDIRNITETTLNVTWAPDAYFGLHIVHYVEFRIDGSTAWMRSTDEVMLNHKVITDLERGTYYEVRVVALDNLYRANSETKVVRTFGFAAARPLGSNNGSFIGLLVGGHTTRYECFYEDCASMHARGCSSTRPTRSECVWQDCASVHARGCSSSRPSEKKLVG
ncbi:hypothetical protein DPMN_129800 [Dreissena polymorpha]|uniref:Uncharacterized protein n=1 Tax=Dreissena polymorpha TaxID=45954 RepID=A0A9D4K0V8_DREPO|nr:hypothetical protein DPMN_129800 [Dreissena polymorpha]